MTEKEKAKAYDEAIGRAKKLYSNGIAEEIFPELKESEDEKIRKEIISILRNAYWISNKNRFNELVAWLENQRDKDKLIQDLGEYKVKYTQEVLEKYVNSMSNKDDERLRKTAIAFLKDFAEQGYENAVECIDWLEKQCESNPYSGVSFKYNGHTWCMYGRDNGVEILVDGEIKERIFLDNKPQGKSALEAIKEEKVDNVNKL